MIRITPRILLILVLQIQLAGSSIANKVSDDKARASLLYYISDLFTWPQNDTIETFNIGVLGHEPVFTKELERLVETHTINNKKVLIKAINEFDDPDEVQVLFVESSYHKDIAEILGYCQKYHILQVTDRLENKRYTVINFVEDIDNEIGFEVNKDNLDATNLDYEDELLLLGGNLKDLKELYKATKQLLEREAGKVYQLNQNIINKNKELALKNSSIDSLSVQINERKDSLSELLTTINEQAESLEIQKGTYESTKRKLWFVQQQHDQHLTNISKKELELLRLDSAIKDHDSIIQLQLSTIEQKDFTIESKNRLVNFLSLFGGAILLLGLLIYRAYYMKKRNNRKLEEKVAQRTRKLTETNENLQYEIRRRQKFENELVKSERNYREIFNASIDAIFILDLSGDVLDVNKASLEMFRYKMHNIRKISFTEFSSDEENFTKERAFTYLAKAKNSGKVVFDWKAKRRDGGTFWVEVALKKTNIAGNDCLLSIVRDIDEKKTNAIELERYREQLEQMVDDRTIELKEANQELNTTNRKLNDLNVYLKKQKKELELTLEQLKVAQDQLVESEKMAAIGVLAAGVAHEINNPLNYIKGGVSGIKAVLEEQNETDVEISELIMGVNTGVERASRIVASLNHFSRQSEVLDEECDIHSIIENCIALLQHLLKNRIKIDRDYNTNRLIFIGNEGKIHQVILNILTNAAQAIEGEGYIWITTGIYSDEDKIFIQIRDSGTGIKPEYLDKITNPFFTTKEPGKGTGLGLSITKKIISDHYGTLSIESKVGEGTSVLINLPLNA